MVVLVLFSLGLLVGPIASFFGVGGGFLIVPVLYWICPGLPPQSVIATSLGVICLNCLVNVRNFMRARFVPRWRLSALIVAVVGVGTLVGGTLASRFDAGTLKTILAWLLLSNSVTTFFARPAPSEPEDYSYNVPLLLCALPPICLGGVVAGVSGLGGGIVILPVLYHLLKIPFRRLPLYSNIAMIGGSSVGTVKFALVDGPADPFGGGMLSLFQWGHVNGAVALCIFLGACVTSPVGIRLKGRVRGLRDRRLLSVLLFGLSMRLFWDLRG